MRTYIENVELPQEILHLNKGGENNHKIKDSIFNRRLLECFTDNVYFNGLSDLPEFNSKIFPALPHYLADYQKQAVAKCLINRRWGLFLSPGSGKTNIVCEFLNEYLRIYKNVNICVIAPKTLHTMWRLKLKEILGIDFTIRESSDNIVCNVEWFYKNYPPNIDYTDTIFIYDESGVVVSKESERYKKLKIIFGKDNYRKLIFCTGSPFSNKVIDIWPQLNLLYPEDFSSYWDFAKIFHNVEIDRYGWKIKEQFEWSTGVLNYCLQNYVSMDRLEDHVTLPPQTEETIYVKMTDLQILIYNELEGKLFYQDGTNTVYIDNKLDLLVKLKKVSSDLSLLGIDANTAKLDYLYELLKTVSRPCVVFGTFNNTLKKIAQRTGGLYFAADGYPPDDFLSGKRDLLIAQIKSGKFGLSFNRCKTVIYYDYNFDSDDLWQAKHRVRRFNSTETVKNIYLLGSDIDEAMLKMNERRNNSTEDLMREYERIYHDSKRDK